MSQYTHCDYSPYPYTHHPPTPSTTPTACASDQFQRWEPLVPFETAMESLYTTLTAAVASFKTLDSSFDEETRSIRAYASSAVMEELWKCKVSFPTPAGGSGWAAAKHGGDSHSHSHSRHRNGLCGGTTAKKKHASKPDQPAPANSATIYDHLQSIDHVLLDAIYCRWPCEQADGCDKPPTSLSMSCLDIDGLNRLREKLWVQDQALRRISGTNRVVRARSCLAEVVKECEMLLFYLERTRALWVVM
ncbi:hypothetical protein PHISP_06981 [Aspergillus sp. HF37]|nr:hypothetical protein PHISP_06981 [Aspergillus sp. HF37]